MQTSVSFLEFNAVVSATDILISFTKTLIP